MANVQIGNTFLNTVKRVKELAAKTNEILVAYSGGKDSLVIMDLCHKHFARVVPFFLYLVPGLSVIERQFEWARRRWGVDVLQFPHPALIRAARNGLYCPSYGFRDMPDVSDFDLYDYVRHTTGIQTVAHGAKRSDSLWRRRSMEATKKKHPEVFYPIKDWMKWDVLAYLKLHDIPRPTTWTGNATGIGLRPPCIIWLYHNCREDYELIKLYFPYIEAILRRKEWYNIPAEDYTRIVGDEVTESQLKARALNESQRA